MAAPERQVEVLQNGIVTTVGDVRKRKEQFLQEGARIAQCIGATDIFVIPDYTSRGLAEFIIIKEPNKESYLLVAGKKDEVASIDDPEKVRARARYIINSERRIVGDWALVPIDIDQAYIRQDMQNPEEYLKGRTLKT